jgi:hypothetical protein
MGFWFALLRSFLTEKHMEQLHLHLLFGLIWLWFRTVQFLGIQSCVDKSLTLAVGWQFPLRHNQLTSTQVHQVVWPLPFFRDSQRTLDQSPPKFV